MEMLRTSHKEETWAHTYFQKCFDLHNLLPNNSKLCISLSHIIAFAPVSWYLHSERNYTFWLYTSKHSVCHISLFLFSCPNAKSNLFRIWKFCLHFLYLNFCMLAEHLVNRHTDFTFLNLDYFNHSPIFFQADLVVWNLPNLSFEQHIFVLVILWYRIPHRY